jgi:hypothetical protein
MAMKTETRQVAGFSSIELRGSGEITLQQNPNADGMESLVVEADESVLPRLTSQVKDGRLILNWETPGWDILGWLDWITLPKKARFSITCNQLNSLSMSGSGSLASGELHGETLRISISGSGKVNIEGLEYDQLSGSISGSGDFDFKGKARKVDIRISGSGKIRAAGLESEETSIHISGSGYAAVNASKALDVSISGSGEVVYQGTPKISQSISGSGKVVAMKE